MNVISPLRRDEKNDWAHGSGPDLVASKIKQVLGTQGAIGNSSGELPWRMDFGSAVDRLRHQNNNAVLKELARVYVEDALAAWVPEVEVTEVTTRQEGAKLFLSIRYRIREIEQSEGSVDIGLEG